MSLRLDSPRRRRQHRRGRPWGKISRKIQQTTVLVVVWGVSTVGLVLLLMHVGGMFKTQERVEEARVGARLLARKVAQPVVSEKAPPGPMARKLSSAERDVDAALGQEDFAAAHAAVDRFRFELVGVKDVEGWKDKAYALSHKIDQRLEGLIDGREKTLKRLLVRERWFDASQLIAQIQRLDSANRFTSRIDDMNDLIQRAKDGEEPLTNAGAIIIPEDQSEKSAKNGG